MNTRRIADAIEDLISAMQSILDGELPDEFDDAEEQREFACYIGSVADHYVTNIKKELGRIYG